MTPSDHQLLRSAQFATPPRGVRITAARGVWHYEGRDHWCRFEGPATIAGTVSVLDDEAVTVRRGDLTITVLLGELENVRDNVSFRELAEPISLDEALALTSGEVVGEQATWEVAA